MSHCRENRACSLDADVDPVDTDTSMLVGLYEKSLLYFFMRWLCNYSTTADSSCKIRYREGEKKLWVETAKERHFTTCT